jgi:AAA15 family ATPase/GTPase
MIIKSLEYYEFENDEKFWKVKSFELGRINLFAAKNATGKSRTLTSIYLLSKMIKNNLFNDHANHTVEFCDNSETYKYAVKNDDKKVVFEKLIGNKGILLQRDETGHGEMFTEEFDRNIEFQLPGKKLAISRRDLIQYPYLEKIHSWAEGVRHYSFGTSMKQEYGKYLEDNLDGNSDNSVEVFIVGTFEFDKNFRESVLESMKSIGYDLNEISVQQGLYLNSNVHHEDHTLFAFENDRKSIVDQFDMSQGMFRALSIIIHLTYQTMMKEPATILIDDIGEGLDFERSTKLIKLLIETAEENDNIQLVMSTNDRYVMNNVPFKYWQLIDRKGGECNVFNYYNSKDIFDEFKFTGLNNFDFLATDFINAKREQK